MAEGMSEKRAAEETGLPRANLQRYIQKGKLPDGLPIFLDQVSERRPADAAHTMPIEAEGCSMNGHPTNPEPEMQQSNGQLPAQRDLLGKFLPGNQIGASYSGPARKAKSLLVDFAPTVAKTLINMFNALPTDRPELVLAFAKEILDRGLGKPVQAIALKETQTYEEYRFFEAAVMAADADAIRSAASLAQRLEEHARNTRGASFLRQMEIIPPPGGTLHNLVPGGGREVSETDCLDASANWEE